MLTFDSFADNAVLTWYLLYLQAVGGSDLSFTFGLVIPPNVLSDSPPDYGIKPVTSTDCNQFGDHACHHDNLSGHLHCTPSGMCSEVAHVRDSSPTWSPPYHYIGSTFHYDGNNYASVTPECTTWIYFGRNGSLPSLYQENAPSTTYPDGRKEWVDIEWSWRGPILDLRVLRHEWYRKIRVGVVDYYNILHYAYNFANWYLSDTKTMSGVLYSGLDLAARNQWPVDNPDLVPTQEITKYARRITGWGNAVQLPEIDFSEFATHVHNSIPPTDPNIFGDLCREAISDIHAVDINSIAYLREILEIKDSFLKLYRLLKGDITPKNIASLFLSFKYGLRLTALDTKEISEAAFEFLADRAKYRYRYCRAMDGGSTTLNKGYLKGFMMESQYNYKVYYDPIDNDVVNIYRKLVDLDLFPSLQNVWDLIPFSFVVDWFVDFEKLFNTLDTRAYIATLDVHGVLKTTRRTITNIPFCLVDKLIHLDGIGSLSGEFSYTIYDRVLGETLDLPQPRLDIQEDFSNFAELTAIIVTQLR